MTRSWTGTTSWGRGRAVAMIGSIVLAVSMIAIGPAAGPAAAASGKGTITGRVRDAATGAPLAGRTVFLYDRNHTKRLRHVRTDTTGRYTFAKVSLRNYLVWATGGPEYIPAYYGDTVHAGEAKVVKVKKAITYTRNIRVHRSAVVTGQVVDDEGLPVGGSSSVDALISGVDTYSAIDEGDERNVGADGRFRLTGFATGVVRLRYFDTVGREGTAQVRVTAGQETSVTVVATRRVRAEGEVRGRVVSAHPVTVSYGTDRTDPKVWKLSPDENGDLAPTTLPVGKYHVWVPGRNLPARTVTVTDGSLADFGTIVDGGQWTTLKGRIVHANGTACNACTFRLLDAKGFLGPVGKADSKGNYRVTGLNAGAYTIEVWAPRRRGGPGAPLLTRRSVSVPKKESVLKKNVRLVEGYRVSGRVLFKKKPVGDALVSAPGEGPSVVTDALGRFSIAYLASGTHQLRIEERVTGGYRPRLVKLTVKGKSRSGVVLRLDRGALVPAAGG